MDLSIVIPVYKEMRLERTILRIRQTCRDLPELILVFDGDNPANYVVDYPATRLKTIHHPERLGTGPSRHAGMVAASHETVFQTDGHVDWPAPGWAEKIQQLSNQFPEDVLCCKCQPLFLSNMTFKNHEYGPHHGATLRLRKLIMKKQRAFDKDWNDEQPVGIIPLVMGASYTLKRSRYFNELQSPWLLNAGWGNDEQTISIVNWICGGESRLVDVLIGHQMDTARQRREDEDLQIYITANRLALIRALRMDDYLARLLQWWMVDDPQIAERISEVEAAINVEQVERLRAHLEKQPRTFDDYVKRFNVPDIDRDDFEERAKLVGFINPEFYPATPRLKTDRQIAIKSLPRSGSHMLPDWIISQLKGKVHWATAMNLMAHRSNDPRCFSRSNHFKLPSSPVPGGNRKTHIYTFEKMHPRAADSIPWIDAGETKTIILLRSPFNFIASFIENTHPDLDKHALRNMWVEYAVAWINAAPNHIRIYYDRFVQDADYRDRIADQIGVDVRSDHALERISNYGRGSSFDGVRLDGKASEMKVTERWRHYENEPWMQRLMADVEVESLIKQVKAHAEKT